MYSRGKVLVGCEAFVEIYIIVFFGMLYNWCFYKFGFDICSVTFDPDKENPELYDVIKNLNLIYLYKL